MIKKKAFLMGPVVFRKVRKKKLLDTSRFFRRNSVKQLQVGFTILFLKISVFVFFNWYILGFPMMC